jgi:serine/threonine protein kinase
VASAAELSTIDNFYDLAYNPSTDSFYSFFSLISPAEQIIASYTLVANSNGTFNTATVTQLAPYDLSSPLALLWARCPYVGVPSPSPSPASGGGGSDAKEQITISFSTIGPVMIVILLIICYTPVVWWLVWRRRRRYYADGGSNGEGSEESSDVEMNDVKYSYREVDYADLTLGRELGHGAFGRVYRGEYRGAAVAVKMFEGVRLDEADEKTLRELRKEAEMMEKLSNHPNIVKFVGAITQASGGASTFALVTEYCCRGSLYDLLVRKNKRLPLITLVQMARDVALGLLHLHKEHVVHRDVAARNILVGKNYEVYVADFGLARTKAAEARAATTTQTFGPIAWMAPEALQNLEYSEATDAFSFGVLLWEMMARKRPWAGLDGAQIVASVTSNMRPQIPKDCDPMFKQIIKQCWKHNPAKRPSFEQVVKSFVAYHKNLKKVMSFTSDSVDSEESDSTSESSDEFELLDGDEQRDPRVRRMQGEIKSLLRQFLCDRRGEGSFETVERANLAVLQDLRADLQRRNDEHAGDDSASTTRMVDSSSGQFTPQSEPAVYATATLPSDDAVTGYDEVSATTDDGYAQVQLPSSPKGNGEEKETEKGGSKHGRGTKRELRRVQDGEEWTVLEQPRPSKAEPEGEVEESYLDLTKKAGGSKMF